MRIVEHDEILSNVTLKSPHVVILGAGASVAAFLEGDRNGRRLPLMADLVEVAGLATILRDFGVEYDGQDFESLYSGLASESRHSELTRLLEGRLYEYFEGLELPDEPTLYDYLVLSLREKDVIATFNWDPFLWHAAQRAFPYAPVPHLIFLHGNVAVGYCSKHKRKGLIGENCDSCGQQLEASRLLFPTTSKDYQTSSEIAAEWSDLRAALQNAFLVTLFGYSAPRTDRGAIALMKSTRAKRDKRLDEIEIIDIKDEGTLYETWKPLIVAHHFHCRRTFAESALGAHPRRTCEAAFSAMMALAPYRRSPTPIAHSLDELHAWAESYVGHE